MIEAKLQINKFGSNTSNKNDNDGRENAFWETDHLSKTTWMCQLARQGLQAWESLFDIFLEFTKTTFPFEARV